MNPRLLIVSEERELRTWLRHHVEILWPDAAVEEMEPAAFASAASPVSKKDLDLIVLGAQCGAAPEDPATGLEPLRQLAGRDDVPPIVIIASGGNELTAVRAMRLGAADYLPRMRALVLLEQQLRPWVGPATHVYCVNGYPQPLPFYLQRTCTLVGYRGELDFGLQQEPSLALADLKQFAPAWQQQSDALAILRPEDYQELEALGAPMRVLYTAPSFVAVLRR